MTRPAAETGPRPTTCVPSPARRPPTERRRPGRPRRSDDATIRAREDGWLARVETLGESPRLIALDSKFSLRTVRYGIAAAKARRDQGVKPSVTLTGKERRVVSRGYGKSKDPAIIEWLATLR